MDPTDFTIPYDGGFESFLGGLINDTDSNSETPSLDLNLENNDLDLPEDLSKDLSDDLSDDSSTTTSSSSSDGSYDNVVGNGENEVSDDEPNNQDMLSNIPDSKQTKKKFNDTNEYDSKNSDELTQPSIFGQSPFVEGQQNDTELSGDEPPSEDQKNDTELSSHEPPSEDQKNDTELSGDESQSEDDSPSSIIFGQSPFITDEETITGGFGDALSEYLTNDLF